MAQAESVVARLRQRWPDVPFEIVPIKTSGDKGLRDVVGAFVKEIQAALLDEAVDFALHCLKDLPVEQVPGLRLSAHLVREDPRDALISTCRGLDRLPENALVGTGSVRRSAQLAALRADLRYRPIYGNIDTRLGKLIAGEYDAIVLAIAGLRRLGLMEDWSTGPYQDLHVELFKRDAMLPAAGQAVLVLETRSSDAQTHEIVTALHHEATEREAAAERAFLRGFGGGCSLPVAARAKVEGGELTLTGLVASPDGSTLLRDEASGTSGEAERIAAGMVANLSARGAKELIAQVASLPAEAPR